MKNFVRNSDSKRSLGLGLWGDVRSIRFKFCFRGEKGFYKRSDKNLYGLYEKMFYGWRDRGGDPVDIMNKLRDCKNIIKLRYPQNIGKSIILLRFEDGSGQKIDDRVKIKNLMNSLKGFEEEKYF